MFIEILKIRNELDKEAKHQLAPLIAGSGVRGEISIIEVAKLLDESLMMKYIDLTEKFIVLVDDLLETLNDFMINFPQETNGLLKRNTLRTMCF